MADILASGLAWLRDQLKAGAAQRVVYCRGEERCNWSVTFGSSLLKLTDGATGRVKIERTARDFIGPAADLDFGAGPVVPQRGDEVLVTIGGTTERFEIISPGGEPCFRFCDPHRTILRVHSKSRGTL